MSSAIPTEHSEAIIFKNSMQKLGLQCVHIPNEIGAGGAQGYRIGKRKKSEGVRKGFPDYLIFLKNMVVAIELKRERKMKKNGEDGASPSTTSKEQIQWVLWLNTLPYCKAYICYGANEAIARVVSHIKP